MPKKIKNYLTDGIPSKIYLKAYPEPISRYKISKELYPIGKQTSSKIIEWSKILLDEGFIKQIDKKGILSDVNPLIREIENNLKQEEITLTEIEKKELSIFLENDFRQYLKSINKDAFNGGYNAYTVLSFYLGFIAKTKVTLYELKFSDLERMNNVSNYCNPEHLRIVFNCPLDKNLLSKLANLKTLDIKPILELVKNSIKLYENNKDLSLSI